MVSVTQKGYTARKLYFQTVKEREEMNIGLYFTGFQHQNKEIEMQPQVA